MRVGRRPRAKWLDTVNGIPSSSADILGCCSYRPKVISGSPRRLSDRVGIPKGGALFRSSLYKTYGYRKGLGPAFKFGLQFDKSGSDAHR